MLSRNFTLEKKRSFTTVVKGNLGSRGLRPTAVLRDSCGGGRHCGGTGMGRWFPCTKHWVLTAPHQVLHGV